MRIRGSLAQGLLISLAVLLIPVSAVSAQKISPGSTCKVLNQKVVYQNKTYACVKSGKKLIWNKGVAVKTPTPTPTPAPTSTPTATSTPTPTPTSFNNLVVNYKGIAIAAWTSTQGMIQKAGEAFTTGTILIGPDTNATNSEAKVDFATASKMWALYDQPKQFVALYYGFSDIQWAKSTGAQLVGNNIDFLVDMNCSISRCNGANANISNPYLLNFGVSKQNTQAYFTNGGIEFHEFTHLVQYAQFNGNQVGLNSFSRMPCWFREGQAHLAGITGAASTFAEYEKNRKDWLNAGTGGLITDFEKETIVNFFNNSCSDTSGHVYDVGYFGLEALASLKGTASTMDVLKLMNSGLPFEASFQSVYGVTLSEAIPIISEAVSLQFKQHKNLNKR